MRILFCSPNPLTKEQGAAKVLIELADEMEAKGWTCDIMGPTDVCPDLDTPAKVQERYAEELRRFLLQRASDYDVVDYDHCYLPFARGEFPTQPLFVARSALLTHHLETIPIPFKAFTWKSHFGRVLKEPQKRKRLKRLVSIATRTIEEADLINVNNSDAKLELVRRGIPPEKIVVIPLGISRSRRLLFDAVSSEPPVVPRVAFVGTFDARKGAREFPRIVHHVVQALPEVRFRLLGTTSVCQTAGDVLRHFPPSERNHIEVVPKFNSNDLPGLLSECSVGVFPSHIEGFGLGVLEMLAASLPVVAYNAPGPSMMLPKEYLVARGNATAMGEKVIFLLRDKNKLHLKRRWAKQQSQKFSWEQVACRSIEYYTEAIRCRELKSQLSQPS